MSVVRIVLTKHALERFHERVRPALDPDAAGRELERLAQSAPLAEVPAWYAEHIVEDVEPPDAAAELAPGVVLLLCRHGRALVAVSCVTRSGLSDAARTARNRRKRHWRRVRQDRRRKHKHDRRPEYQ